MTKKETTPATPDTGKGSLAKTRWPLADDDAVTSRRERPRAPDLASTMELGDDDFHELSPIAGGRPPSPAAKRPERPRKDTYSPQPPAEAADEHPRPLDLGSPSPTTLIPAETASVHDMRRSRRPARLALILVGLALVAAALVGGVAYYLTTGRSPAALFDNADDEVLILVVTHPRSATLYVDGALQKRKSLQLKRARRHVVLRAEAKGYRPAKRVVALGHTRVIHLNLKPRSTSSSPAPHTAAPTRPAASPQTPTTTSQPDPRPGVPVPQADDTEKAPIE